MKFYHWEKMVDFCSECTFSTLKSSTTKKNRSIFVPHILIFFFTFFSKRGRVKKSVSRIPDELGNKILSAPLTIPLGQRMWCSNYEGFRIRVWLYPLFQSIWLSFWSWPYQEHRMKEKIKEIFTLILPANACCFSNIHWFHLLSFHPAF